MLFSASDIHLNTYYYLYIPSILMLIMGGFYLLLWSSLGIYWIYIDKSVCDRTLDGI
ncbi:hypothetical protein BDV26DRAFT_272499 [Aspergillus bertholletiae]|uniref:Uncharacterized protein n=1 Tax=Aspergillus bertholletiae TaxID=1226010 RepID=A0A5N7AW26_9EURO|nr:hypothetical protein BDV26DRAFT_272499 [Aspergillus bertholletiae]